MSATIRPLDLGDIPGVSAVCDEALILDPAGGRIAEVLLRHGRAGLVATTGARVAGICLVSQDAIPGTGVGYVDLIAVVPAEQRTGVGRQLLAAGETVLAGLGCTRVRVRGNPPHYAWPGVDARYLAAHGLLASMSYRRESTAVNLGVALRTAPLDTRDDESRLAQQGISCRRAEAADLERFAGQLAKTWGPALIDEIRAALDSEHGGLHLAVLNATCVGFCAYGVTWPRDVGPLGTNPQVRNLGVGSTLIRRCLHDQRARGLDRAEIQWAGPVDWLTRTLDAVPGRTFHTYGKHLPV